MTPRKCETGRPLTLSERAGLLCRLEGCCREDRCLNVGALGCLEGEHLGAGTVGMTDVDSAWVFASGARGCCLGDGWPSRDRAVDAPALQDVPAWDGIVAWLSRRANPLEPGEVSFCRVPLTLLQAMQREVDLIAYGQFSPQQATWRSAAFRQPPQTEGLRPLVGSLHRRGRLQSAGLGEVLLRRVRSGD